MPAPTIISITPSEGAVGTGVIIAGTDFTGTTNVEFNGVSASFVVDSDSQITTEVPVGAETGDVIVTNPSGSDTYSEFYVLPTVPADGYQIELYQIRVNLGETDIEMVPGTYQNYFTEGIPGDTISIIPESFSTLERSVEWEEGVYKFGNVDLTLSLLPADYFNDYTEYVQEPFVCIVRDAVGTVLFHGPVDPEKCTYNAATRKTAISVLSWEVLLQATNSPCRSIYETQFSRSYNDSESSLANSVVFFQQMLNGVDLATVVVPGSVLVYDTPGGEQRSIVIAAVDVGSELAVYIFGKPTAYYTLNKAIANTACTVTTVGSGGLTFKRLKMEFVDATLWANLENAFKDGKDGLLTVEVGAKVYTLPLRNSEIFVSGAWYFLDDDRQTIRLYHNINAADITEFTTNGCDISISTTTVIEAGDSVKILGAEMYGFMDSTPFVGHLNHYDIDGGVMQGLFSLPELGVLPYIVDEFDFPAGYNRQIDKWAELPPQLLDALRQIQNTHYTFLNFTPRTLNGLPRLTVVVRPRTDANTSSAPTISGGINITKWTENAANLTPTAVVVVPYIDYFKPVGTNETVGFYYDGVDVVDPAVTGKPRGGRVVEITVNVTPSYSGDLFFGDGPVVRNDDRLRTIAEQFYLFYKNLKRPCEFVVHGTPSVDWLTKFLIISEIDDPLTEELFERNVFVTHVIVDPNSNQTTVKGRIGEYTPSAAQDPVAVIDGQLVWNDDDDSGDQEVRLSAARSYDPQGDPLTYEWKEGITTLSTDRVFVETLAVGDHVIDLIVTDPDMNTDTTQVTVKVQAISETLPDGDLQQAEFIVADWVINSDGDLFVTVTGDELTRTTNGIKIRTAATQGGLSGASDTSYNNPLIAQEIATAMSAGAELWVRVTLVNDEDGSTSTNVWEFFVVNVGGGGGTSPVTTKGDLIAGDSSGDEDRLAVGTDGQILMADSSAPLGVKWVNPSEEGLTFPNIVLREYSLILPSITLDILLIEAP